MMFNQCTGFVVVIFRCLKLKIQFSNNVLSITSEKSKYFFTIVELWSHQLVIHKQQSHTPV